MLPEPSLSPIINIVAAHPLEAQSPVLGMTVGLYQDLLEGQQINVANNINITLGRLISSSVNVTVYQVHRDGETYVLRIERSNNIRNLEAANQLAGYIGNNLRMGPFVYGSDVIQLANGDHISFILMELGRPVEDYCDRASGDPRGCRVTFVAEMHAILQRLMQLGIFCVDIKPDNSLVHISGPNVGKLMLIDFGMDWCLVTGPEQVTPVLANAIVGLMTLQYAHLLGVGPQLSDLVREICALFRGEQWFNIIEETQQSELGRRVLRVASEYLEQPDIRSMIAKVCGAPGQPTGARRRCVFPM